MKEFTPPDDCYIRTAYLRLRISFLIFSFLLFFKCCYAVRRQQIAKSIA